MNKWLLEFQAYRAIINQAGGSPEAWDYKILAESFIKRFEEALVDE